MLLSSPFITFLEFLYYLSGISLLPFWNFFITFREFLYYLSGISLLPFNALFHENTRFSASSNQGSNQVSNQVYNQAFNQGEHSSKAAVERKKERTRIVSGCRRKGNIMSSILLPFVEIIITFPEDHVHLSMRFFTKTRVFRHPVIKRVIGHSIKGGTQHLCCC